MSNNKNKGIPMIVLKHTEKIIEKYILYNQSNLIFNFLKHPEILHPFVEDQYEEIILNRFNDHGEEQEIYEWWLVSRWLAERLHDNGQPMIFSDFGSYWGRTCTGQHICLDGTIQEMILPWFIKD